MNIWQQVNDGVEEELNRLEIFKLTHRKKGSTDEHIDSASTNVVVSI